MFFIAFRKETPMPSQINLPAILIANMMGLTILFCVAISSFWRSKISSIDKKILFVISATLALLCIADSVASVVDGHPGAVNRILAFTCNTWLFIGTIVVSISWVFFVGAHLNIKPSRLHKWIMLGTSGAASILLVINFFYPIVFALDENNVYSRVGLYPIYYVLHIVFMIDSLIQYFYAMRKSGNTKFFPVWAFIVPAAIGEIVQGFFYGVSTITPFLIVSLSCIIGCLQNEFINKDKLTGLYNRFYLDILEEKILKDHPGQYTIIMMDINNFKKINDTFGHKMGDRALIQFSDIIRNIVGINGEVIRYAGDEFVLILNDQNGEKAQNVITDINNALEKFNESTDEPYKLSVSEGHCRVDLRQATMDVLFNRVDKLMYENKRAYYKSHDRRL